MSWRRVTRHSCCPVCGHADWCLVTEDGGAAICPRTQEGARRRCGNAGWLHVLRVAVGTTDSIDHPRWQHQVSHRPPPDWSQRVRLRVAETSDEQLHDLAQTLGLAGIAPLRRLDVFWAERCGGWGFPMRDQHATVRGIRLRMRNGRKLSARGGREGVFLPGDQSGADQVLLPEGPSDTAAALELGFLAIGRPSALGGVRQLGNLVVGRDVVILADQDEVGQRGAQSLASAVILHANSVRVITPPAKDLRAWYAAGATRGDLESLIQAAESRSLHVVEAR